MYEELLMPLPLAAVYVLIIHLIKNKFFGDDKKRVTKVLFFADEVCEYHVIHKGYECNKPTCVVNNKLKIMSVIAAAKHTLDVCMYSVTMEDMAVEVVNAQKRGVKVRFISDASMAQSNGSKIEILRKNRIPFRLRSCDYLLMHHKFVIIDNEILLVGSLNWTTQAFFGNWDHVLISTHQGLVQAFKEEFNFMWETLDADLKKNRKNYVS